MLVAHLVPGYFAGVAATDKRTQWSDRQRILLWTVALGVTAVPDFDVIYNSFFRGFINHSTLWTHSIFVYLAVGLVWILLWFGTRWRFVTMLVGLVAFGGLSHLLLDALSHGSPMLYPLSWQLVGIAPRRVVIGGFWAYITDPIFLFEPFLLTLVVIHWTLTHNLPINGKRLIIACTAGGLVLFCICFLVLLPDLQGMVLPLMRF